jgi:hypothetical protein
MSRFSKAQLLFRLLTAVILSTPLAPKPADAGLVFDFTEGAGLTSLSTINPTLYAQVINGFHNAAGVWQSVLHDNVTLKFEIDYAPLGVGIIGSTTSATYVGSYEEIRDALRADAQQTVDQNATNALPNTPSLVLRTNDRSGAPILDNDVDNPLDPLDDAFVNNSYIVITGANVRALGIMPDAFKDNTDASITFSSNFSFDFDRSDGIGPGLVDFIGTAAHEIGHALGFLSGIDVVDYYTGSGTGATEDLNGAAAGIGTLDSSYYFTVLDLFRSSTAVLPGTYDWTTGGNPGLTVDGGNTIGTPFSTGMQNGDGRQAGHWKDNLGLGIMDPTLAFGELAVVTANDLLAFDVIGWDLQAVPEPSSLLLCSSAVAGWYVRRRRAAAASVADKADR